ALSGRDRLKPETLRAPANRVEPAAPGSFLAFAEACAAIGADTRKLEKVRLLSQYLRQLQGQALGLAATWFTGRPFAASHNKVLQLGWALLRDALSSAVRVDTAVFHQVYLKHSDLGETAAEMLASQTIAPSLSPEDV